MNKITVNDLHIDKVDELIEATIAKLYQDPFVQRKIDQLKITDSEVHTHLATLLRFQEEQQDVQRCVAANACVKKSSHYILDIDRDEGGHVRRLIKPCPMTEKQLSAQQYLIHLDYDQAIDHPEAFANLKQRRVLSELHVYLTKALSKTPGQNLYLFGPHNAGKTYALAVFAYKYALNELGTIALIKTHTWLEKLLSFKQYDGSLFQKELDALSQVDILILDELGAKDLDEVSRDQILIPLLSERLKLRKKTMISSVFSLKELVDIFKKYPSWLPRVKELISLIENQAKVIELPPTFDL